MLSLLDKLNPDQRAAVTSKARHLLVLAGAGSGKTYVIARRILYLIESMGAKPEEILAITFTRNAAREMSQRLEEESAGRPASSLRVNLRTFHSLCYLILRRHWRLVFDSPLKLIAETPVSSQDTEKVKETIGTKSEILLEAARNLFPDPGFRITFKRYLWDYFLIPDESDRYGRNPDPRSQRFFTLTGLAVRSYAERDIANWLYENKIRFLYNQHPDWGYPSFRPDFYLPDFDTYLEVWEFENPGKAEQRSGKRWMYKAHGKRLIEVVREEVLNFPALERRLAAALPEAFPGGVPQPGDPRDLDRLLDQETGYPEAIKTFLALAEEVLDRMKNHSVDSGKLEERARRERNLRTRTFFDLFLPIYDEYQKLLLIKGAVDFNDLILRTVELLRLHPALRDSYRSRWKYILVDEYQDVNTPQVMLLKELLGPESILTCVGDDWQSIYAFRGSNVSHILNFAADFAAPAVIPLRVNYRSGHSIVDFAGVSIRKCREYNEKPLYALKRDVQKIILYRTRHLYDDGVAYVVARIQELVELTGQKPQDILILYRRSASYRLLGEALRQAGLKVRHETIHGAKGLQARTVILWALTGGRGGFPSIREEGRIMQVLLGFNYDRRLDEERRIFYVSLTRALERLILITEKNNQSQFLDNLPERYFEPSASLEVKPVIPGGASHCVSCGKTLLPEYSFCPFCFAGLKEHELTRITHKPIE